jgi:hypothetical protein
MLNNFNESIAAQKALLTKSIIASLIATHSSDVRPEHPNLFYNNSR